MKKLVLGLLLLLIVSSSFACSDDTEKNVSQSNVSQSDQKQEVILWADIPLYKGMTVQKLKETLGEPLLEDSVTHKTSTKGNFPFINYTYETKDGTIEFETFNDKVVSLYVWLETPQLAFDSYKIFEKLNMNFSNKYLEKEASGVFYYEDLDNENFNYIDVFINSSKGYAEVESIHVVYDDAFFDWLFKGIKTGKLKKPLNKNHSNRF